MKTKSFAVLALSVLALTLFISSISALTFNPNSTSLTFTQIGSSQLVLLGNDSLLTNISYPSTLNSNGATFSITNTTPSTLQLTFTGISNYGLASNVLQVNGTNGTGITNTATTNITLNYLKSFCSIGDVNDSNATMYVQVTNLGTGTPTSWNPLDTIQVQVTLNTNGGNTNVNNVYFQLGLINPSNNQDLLAGSQMTWLNGGNNQYSVGQINSQSNSQVQYTFTFQVNPQIFNYANNGGNYYLMVKAYNYNNQNQFCVDYASGLTDGSFINNNYYSSVQIQPQPQNKAIVVDTSSLSPVTQVTCGQQITLSPYVYNVGSSGNNYGQNQVLVILKNPELGINLNQTIYGGLTPGNSQQVPFTFTIPLNANPGTHQLYFQTYYGYNSQNSGPYFGNYQYTSQNSFSTILDVTGGCVYATPDTTGVTAQLVAGGKAGSPLTISSTVTNTGNQTVSYNFGLESYSSWATLSSISPINVTLAPGQSQDVTLNMNINQNAQGGNQIFYLDVYSNGYLITKQPISVPVTAGFSFSSITGNAISGGNWLVWVFGLLILVLIIAIIIVLVKLRRR